MSIKCKHPEEQVQTRRPRVSLSPSDWYSVLCPDLLASSVSLTDSSSGREVGTVRPRRMHNGYTLTTLGERYLFESWSAATAFGTVVSRNGERPEAVLRPVRDGVTAVDIEGATFLVYANHGTTFSIDRVYQNTNGMATLVHSGVAHAVHATNRRSERKTSTFTFDFSEPVPALLIPLMVVLIRESARLLTSFHSLDKPGVPSSGHKMPAMAVTAVVGATIC